MRDDDPGPYSLDLLRRRPAPAVFTLSQDEWRRRLIAWFEAETGRAMQPAQVETLLIDLLSYAMSVMSVEAQLTAEEHLVAYASEAGLERLGANRTTPRLEASAARVTVRLALDAPRDVPVDAPAGLRFQTPGGGVFALATAARIDAGGDHVDAAAVALEPGRAGDGVPAGAACAPLDPIAGLSITTLTISEGGAEREEVEAYRLRVANAFFRLSKAGPGRGYREIVFGVSPAIIDVAVVRPQPCYIEIYPLTREGAAGEELRALVAAGLDAETVRPQGDEVTVLPPTAVVFNPHFLIRARGDQATIEAAMRAATDEAFAAWGSRLAATVSPAHLASVAMAVDGVDDVVVSGVAFTRLAATEFARLGVLTVAFEALA
jgi:phage-related baseplate assembly protein